jgi:hypothetical protein
MIKLIGIILFCFAAVAIIVIFDDRPTHAQNEQVIELTRISVLQIQLDDIRADSEQLSALFRKIDGAQSTSKQAMEATNSAIDLALREHELNTINELRDHLLMLDTMYRATLEEIRLMKVNPKMRHPKTAR